MNIIKLVINNKELDLKLENNTTTKDLIEKLDKGTIELQVDDYGGFEKVGTLPLALTREDKNQTSKNGDVMLYQGNKLVIFTDSNTWSYSKIGELDLSNIENLEETLGAGEQKVILKKS
ncbi:MAG: cyclophilin-like fold protein [Gemella sp.]|nr:cyclophilin-like fold protein [Gemella sp.]